MKILYVFGVVPNTALGGAGVTAYSSILGLLDAGHQVSVLALKCSHSKCEEYINDLKQKGVKVDVLLETNKVSKIRRVYNALFPDFKSVFPGQLYAHQVTAHFKNNQYDVVVAYHWDALAAIKDLEKVLKVGLVGDPIDLPGRFRRSIYSRYDDSTQYSGIRKLLHGKQAEKRLERVQHSGMVRLLGNCQVNGAYAAHHAYDLEKLGVKDCKYFHTPVPEVDREQRFEKDKFKILLMGHLLGVATLSGIELFVNEILPHLDSEIGATAYEVHVVGGYAETLPSELSAALYNHPSVILRGQVVPADIEFLSSDVLLVPTPIELGIRVRIISGFSYGSLIVAHVANKKGIPELEHGVNALLGENGKELGQCIVDVFNKKVEADNIKVASRHTYEQYFSPASFAEELISEIQKVTKGKG